MRGIVIGGLMICATGAYAQHTSSDGRVHKLVSPTRIEISTPETTEMGYRRTINGKVVDADSSVVAPSTAKPSVAVRSSSKPVSARTTTSQNASFSGSSTNAYPPFHLNERIRGLYQSHRTELNRQEQFVLLVDVDTRGRLSRPRLLKGRPEALPLLEAFVSDLPDFVPEESEGRPSPSTYRIVFAYRD